MKNPVSLFVILLAVCCLAATSAYHKVQIVDGTGNPTAYEKVQIVDEEGQNVQIVDASINYLNVRDYGAKGDGINDDTEEIQACIDAAKTAGKTVYFPAPVTPSAYYRISDSLKFSDSGGGLIGENKYTGIHQVTNGEHCIEVLDDASEGTLTRSFIIKNFYLLGNGAGTSTGTGIRMADGESGYNGNWSTIEDIRIEGFQYGLYSYYFDNFRVNGVAFYGNATNIYINGNTNAVTFSNCANVSATVRGIHIASGGRALFQNMDNGNQPQTVYNEGSATFLNCNFENCTGGNGVIEGSNTSLTVLNRCTFLGANSSAPPFYTSGVATLIVDNAAANGFAANTPFAYVTNTTRTIILDKITGTSVLIDKAGTYKHAATDWPVQNDASSRTPSESNRFQPIIYAARDSSAVDDRIFISVKNSLGNYVDEPILNRDTFRVTTATGATTMTGNSRYLANHASTRVVFTLPTDSTISIGMEFEVIGIGAAGWEIAQNASQRIQVGNVVTTTGASGYLRSSGQYDVVRLKKTASNFYEVIYFTGNPVTDAGTYVDHRHLTATATLNFPDTAAQLSADLTITVTGAAVGDAVHIGTPASFDANTSYIGWVSATDTVTVRFNNYSAGSVNPASGTFRAVVYKP